MRATFEGDQADRCHTLHNTSKISIAPPPLRLGYRPRSPLVTTCAELVCRKRLRICAMATNAIAPSEKNMASSAMTWGKACEHGRRSGAVISVPARIRFRGGLRVGGPLLRDRLPFVI